MCFSKLGYPKPLVFPLNTTEVTCFLFPSRTYSTLRKSNMAMDNGLLIDDCHCDLPIWTSINRGISHCHHLLRVNMGELQFYDRNPLCPHQPFVAKTPASHISMRSLAPRCPEAAACRPSAWLRDPPYFLAGGHQHRQVATYWKIMVIYGNLW